MKQHKIIAKVYDHNKAIPRVFEKVCRSKSAAVMESRELDRMPLIRRYAEELVREGNDFTFYFVPFSKLERDGRGRLYAGCTSSYCSVSIHVEDMDGNNINKNILSGCMDFDEEHLCETPEDCNCDRVWPELQSRGFIEV